MPITEFDLNNKLIKLENKLKEGSNLNESNSLSSFQEKNRKQIEKSLRSSKEVFPNDFFQRSQYISEVVKSERT